MIVNDTILLIDAPIKDMLTEKHSSNGVSHGLAEAGYDIRIKQDIHFTHRQIASMNGVTYEMCGIVDNELKPGRFVLASTIEEFDMPDNLLGTVHDKSTWARKGLSVFNTVIEPGWRGFLTLELVYHGSQPLHIPAGSGIAQVLFHRIMCPVTYTGKYQDQEDRPVEAVHA